MNVALPSPSAKQAFCEISALDAGSIQVPFRLFIDIAHGDEKADLPVLAFVLRHSSTGDVLLFDLGVRPDIENYSPSARALMEKMGMVVQGRDIPAALAAGGLAPADVRRVCLSHIHYDHTGVPHMFPNAEFLLGLGSREVIEQQGPHFEGTLYSVNVPLERTTFLDPSEDGWEPLGPFPRALDLYNDGSLYIVDAPGHMQGHINILARTSADGGWVYLAGDSAHDWRLLTGEAGISFDAHFGCAHHEPKQAREHMDRLKVLKEVLRVRVILAHDKSFAAEGKGYWPETIRSL